MAQEQRYPEQERVPLTGRLAEFRTALEAEIDAARRDLSNRSVSLADGKRIAATGAMFQYVFRIENALNLPGDAPGDLIVAEKAPIPVSVVSVEGLTITLSTQQDIGQFVPTARLQSDLTFLLQKLISRIEDIAVKNAPNPTGNRMLGEGVVSGAPDPLPDLQYPKWSPNQGQREAIASAVGRNMTFIWGPPGTGKSQTIGAIVGELFHRGRSVLLVSHTNNAVDQALLYASKIVSPEDLEAGKLIRVGEPKDKRLQEAERGNLLLKTHVEKRSDELVKRRTTISEQRDRTANSLIEIRKKITLYEWVAEATRDLDEASYNLNSLLALEQTLQETLSRFKASGSRLGYWKDARKAAEGAIEIRYKLDIQARKISDLDLRLADSKTETAKLTRRLKYETDLYEQAKNTGWVLRRWKGLPKPDEQHMVVIRCESILKEQKSIEAGQMTSLKKLKSVRDELSLQLGAFLQQYGAEPERVIAAADSHVKKVRSLKEQSAQLSGDCRGLRLSLAERFRRWTGVLEQLGLGVVSSQSLEDTFEGLKNAHRLAADRIAAYDIQKLRQDDGELGRILSLLDAEISDIEQKLQHMEEIIIAEAVVLGTTLTRAYLRDSIQGRRFDTVILDEASMAPIPALWVAAALADNGVVVGDWNQLPPIVVAKDDLAQKWLGRDIFKASGVSDTDPEYLVRLSTQYRMHPAISAIPNSLIYNDTLEDGALGPSEFTKWYNKDWGYDEPVLLVDTGPANAWVTSVMRGRRASRLNFMSATICTDIAERMLRKDRPKPDGTGKHQILIVSPYRPHASLLQLLLKSQKLKDDVLTGTAHSFQGSEAEAVVLDLVNDEPHWRVGMFMQNNDESMKQLLNVAITRARRRLVVVGDFDYICKHGRKAFLARELIPFLKQNYRCVSALDVVPQGLAHRAAQASTSVFGGAVEMSSARTVLTQEHFYPALAYDIERAKHRIVIYSAFITSNRIGSLALLFQSAVQRGVSVYVVTKSRQERKKSERRNYEELERALSRWGVTVVHKRGMHEKVVFLDDDGDNGVVWTGSLNPLSFSNTQEIMERREDREVVQDFAKTLCLDALLREYNSGVPTCPICGEEVVASEGKDQPFYWRDTNEECGFTRDVDAPAPNIEGGILRCFKCGGELEFGTWGEKPSWRCLTNRRHRIGVMRTHLKLRAMRNKIPKDRLARLDKRFGIAPSMVVEHPSVKKPPERDWPAEHQRGLFGAPPP
jgi:hypothetical protein